MTYVYAGAPNPRGMFNTPEAQEQAERLRTLFETGVPVIASMDGLTVTPAPNPTPRPERHTLELGVTEW